MTGVVVTTYNRPQYLKRMLDSLRDADLNRVFLLCVDDGSDAETRNLINEFPLWSAIVQKTQNRGICHSLRTGFDMLIANGCNVLMNLDPDVIVKPNFVQAVQAIMSDSISSGFNTLSCDTKTKKPRHDILYAFSDHYTKRSIGGVNMCMSIHNYRRIVLPNLVNDQRWDWMVSQQMKRMNKFFRVTRPSVIEHIGEESTFADRSNHDQSADFYD